MITDTPCRRTPAPWGATVGGLARQGATMRSGKGPKAKTATARRPFAPLPKIGGGECVDTSPISDIDPRPRAAYRLGFDCQALRILQMFFFSGWHEEWVS